MNKITNSLPWFSRLTYLQKFTLITLIFMIPVIAFTPLINDQVTRIDRYGYKELNGVLYLRPIWQFSESFQTYVTRVREYSTDENKLSEVQQMQAVVETNLGELEEIHNQYNNDFQLDSQFNAVKSQWANVKGAVQNKAWDTFDDRQNLLFTSLHDLNVSVGDVSYLILDPDLDTYYMMDTVLLKMPENQGLLFETWQIVNQAATQGDLTTQDRAELAILVGRIEANLDVMQRNITVAIQNDGSGEITQLVTAPLETYQTSIQALSEAITNGLNASTSSFDINSEQYETVRGSNSLLYEAASQALENSVTNRINAVTSRLYWMVGIALTSILVAFLIGRSTMQSISGPLTQLFEATKRLAAGDMTTRISVTQSDEFGTVADAFNQMALDLEKDKSALLVRSSELNIARLQSEKRAQDLQTISEISRISSSELRLDTLLPLLTRAISEKFDFPHVGIFIVDEKGEFAVLQAANSRGGQALLQRGLKVKLGPDSFVGSVAVNGKPRTTSEIHESEIQPNNPDLPDIHSELAIPLKIAGEVIGVLDVQSTATDIFPQEDVEALSTLADQIAIAIQNARLLSQTQRALKKAEIASSQLMDKAWRGYTESAPTSGYRYDGVKTEKIRVAAKTTEEKDALVIPVQLRGQVIGRLKLKTSDATHAWTDDERAIIESTADRVALAVDSARLLTEAQRRATRETFLSELGAKLSTSFQLDSILRDTVEELGQNLKGSTVSFQLVNPSMLQPQNPEPTPDKDRPNSE